MEKAQIPALGHGKICYVGLPAVSIDSSSAFYHEVFGWTIRTRADGSITFDDGIGEVSGAWILGGEVVTEPGLLISIMVDDVAETIKAIADRGGKLIKQENISQHEVIAWFLDPAGNLIGLYQHPGGGHGKICYLEIPADDAAKAADFYKKAFNWPIRDDNQGNIAFDDGVGVVSGMWVPGRKPSGHIGTLIYIMVDDAEATLALIVAAGGKIIQPVDKEAPNIAAQFSDPAGNILGIFQHN